MTTFKPNPLVIGSFPVKSHVFTVTGAALIAVGTPLKSADGITVEAAQATADADTIVAVASFDIDPSGGDVDASCYASGEFSEAALVLAGTLTAAELNASLRKRGVPIFIG